MSTAAPASFSRTVSLLNFDEFAELRISVLRKRSSTFLLLGLLLGFFVQSTVFEIMIKVTEMMSRITSKAHNN